MSTMVEDKNIRTVLKILGFTPISGQKYPIYNHRSYKILVWFDQVIYTYVLIYDNRQFQFKTLQKFKDILYSIEPNGFINGDLLIKVQDINLK